MKINFLKFLLKLLMPVIRFERWRLNRESMKLEKRYLRVDKDLTNAEKLIEDYNNRFNK